MSILINYKNKLDKKNSSNLILFVDEKFNISALKNYISKSEYSYISDLAKIRDLKKKLVVLILAQKEKSF